MSSPPAAPPLNYYAKYLFALSPTYCCWSRLTAKDVHTALYRRVGFEGQDIWFYLNHPIKWVRVVGIVVAYDDLENRKILTVDDGSGYTIDLIYWKTAPPGTDPQLYKPVNLDGVELHSVVKVKGSVSEFRGTRQMLLRRAVLLKDTNEEVAAWGEATRFKREVLSKPWVLSAETVEREKRKMVGGVEDDQQPGETKRRKLDKTKKQKREVAAGSGKENMESFVLKFDQENRQKEHGEGGNELEAKHQRDTGYLGRRRPPQPPLPSIPEPAKPEITDPISASVFKGRRRATPAPAAPIPAESPREPEPDPILTHRGSRRVSKPPVDIPSSFPPTFVPTPLGSEPTEIPTNHARRRSSKPPTTLPDSVPPLKEDPVAEASTSHSRRKASKHLASESNAIKGRNHVKVPSGKSSTYCGRRGTSKPRDALTSRFVPEELSGSVQSAAGSSTYRGQRETPKASRDELTLDTFPEELLKSVHLSSAESLYRGRRRDPHQPSLREGSTSNSQNRLQELASTLLTQSSEQCTSFRGLQRRLKTQKNTAEMQEMNGRLRTFLAEDEKGGGPQLGKVAMMADAPSRSSQVSQEISYHERWWEPSSPDIQATLPSPMPSVISTYVPSQSQATEDEERSLYRGKRRGGSQLVLDTQELLDFSDFVPTPASQSTVVGSHRISEAQTQMGTQELLELLEFSDFVPSPSQTSASAKGSSFRGRRRNQPINPTLHSPYSPGFLPPSGNPSQLVSPVSQIASQVSSSSYRGKRRR